MLTRLARTVLAAAVAVGCSLTPGPTSAAPTTPQLQYISPLPGSRFVTPETNIILRPGGHVDPSSLGSDALLRVSGSSSGIHEGRLKLSDDGETLTFRPDVPFAPGEVVTCSVLSGLRTDDRGEIPPSEFAFTVEGPDREALKNLVPPEDGDEFPPVPNGDSHVADPIRSAALDESLPADFPNRTATTIGTPSPGRLFLSNISLVNTRIPSYLMILENDGTPYFYRKLPGRGIDWKVQPDGRATYFDESIGQFLALDGTYSVVDSFRCGNGYATDLHDLVILPNGHALLMSYDPQIVDMSQVAPGGFTVAVVVGLVIQELDRDKNVVFQWRSWDHFQITDATHIAFKGSRIDYVHANSIDVDSDGNLLLSSRTMDEVTKISRATGEIIWRLGGKNNEFTFVNDPIGFSRQHDVRNVGNGHITMFDNGNFHDPPFSRGVEYAIDETQKTATLVWEYRHKPDVFGSYLGSVQRLPTGNTLIGWGATTPTLTEVSPTGKMTQELTFDSNVASYRAFRFQWPPAKPATVELVPNTLNAGSRGQWITATIQPVGFDAFAVDLSTVRLAGSVPPDPTLALLGDRNSDGVDDLTIRFDRDLVMRLLTLGTNWLDVTGRLTTGGEFRGTAAVRLVAPVGSPSGSPTPPKLVSAPGSLPVVLALGGTRAAGSQSAGTSAGDELGAGARARARAIAVFDVQGRLVNRWLAPVDGEGRVAWDGRRSDGRRAGSGIYFLRVEDGAAASLGGLGRLAAGGPASVVKVVIAR